MDGGAGDNDIVTGDAGNDIYNGGGPAVGVNDTCEQDSEDTPTCDVITAALACPW